MSVIWNLPYLDFYFYCTDTISTFINFFQNICLTNLSPEMLAKEGKPEQFFFLNSFFWVGLVLSKTRMSVFSQVYLKIPILRCVAFALLKHDFAFWV